jgi:3-deoxy-D-arabino-heptulosonate 7-phosphate (DAHP) synthase
MLCTNQVRYLQRRVRLACAAGPRPEERMMRVNVYAEEMTDRVEIIVKEIDGTTFTGLRLYLELPATIKGKQYRGPFIHQPGDDDSAAITFWGKRDLRKVLRKALELLDEHYQRLLDEHYQRSA